MKNERGVTLASLTIYVIVAGIIIVMLSFLNLNFFSRMTDLTNQTNVTNEYAKFCSAFIRDVKGSDSVLEYNQYEIKFSNGSTYEIRKIDNEDKYAIYRDSIKICENIKQKYVYYKDEGTNANKSDYVLSPRFDYDYDSNSVMVSIVFAKPNVNSYEFETQQVFKIGL